MELSWWRKMSDESPSSGTQLNTPTCPDRVLLSQCSHWKRMGQTILSVVIAHHTGKTIWFWGLRAMSTPNAYTVIMYESWGVVNNLHDFHEHFFMTGNGSVSSFHDFVSYSWLMNAIQVNHGIFVERQTFESLLILSHHESTEQNHLRTTVTQVVNPLGQLLIHDMVLG